MEILAPIFIGWIGFIISSHVGILLFSSLVTRILPVKREKDGTFIIVNGAESDVKIYNLLRNILHHGAMMSNMALGFIFVTSLRGPISLLLGPALVTVFVLVILICVAKFSRKAFARLVGYKKPD